MSCNLCPRQCDADRTDGTVGFCGAAAQIKIARAALHPWEEPCISGTKGAGTVFFSHCTLRCVYCQNRTISGQDAQGRTVSTAQLAEMFLKLQTQGAHNIALVTPDHYVPQLLEVLALARNRGLTLPIVYNCSGYETVSTLQQLDGFVDVYLPDFKYYSSYYAARYSHAPDYFEIASDAIFEMLRQVGVPQYTADGLLQRGVLVRHLMLPSLAGDTAQVLRHLAERFGDRILVSLLRQYTPIAMEAYPELDRTITDAEYEEAVEQFASLGLCGYLQDGESIGESFIPAWELPAR